MFTVKTTFFVGAGFSYNADLPIMTDFNEFAEKERGGIRQNHIDKKTSKADSAQFFVSKLDTYLAFLEYVQSKQKNGIPNVNLENMEEIFTYIEMLVQAGYGEIELKNHATSPRLYDSQEIYDDMTWALYKIFHRLPIHNPYNNNHRFQPNRCIYFKIAELLGKENMQNISLITTNYDMVLEYILDNERINPCYSIGRSNAISYPLTSSSNKFIWWGSDSEIPSNHAKIHKLHGSVNFFKSREGSSKVIKVVHDRLEDGYWVNNTSLEPSIKGIYPPSIMAFDLKDILYEYKPAIIPPTYTKLSEENWLKDIWQGALKSLSESDFWIFVGYSFPKTDGYMRMLINSALQKRKENKTGGSKLPVVLVVDIAEPSQIAESYMPIFGNNYRHLQGSVDQFLGFDSIKELFEYSKAS